MYFLHCNLGTAEKRDRAICWILLPPSHLRRLRHHHRLSFVLPLGKPQPLPSQFLPKGQSRFADCPSSTTIPTSTVELNQIYADWSHWGHQTLRPPSSQGLHTICNATRYQPPLTESEPHHMKALLHLSIVLMAQGDRKTAMGRCIGSMGYLSSPGYDWW
jgi:hypothetical protein